MFEARYQVIFAVALKPRPTSDFYFVISLAYTYFSQPSWVPQRSWTI